MLTIAAEDFNATLLSFGDGIQGSLPSGEQYTRYVAKYSDSRFSVLCEGVRTRTGIQPYRRQDGTILGYHCRFQIDGVVLDILRSIHEKALFINPECKNPLEDDGSFVCTLQLGSTDFLRRAFCGTICLAVKDIIVSPRICKIRFTVANVTITTVIVTFGGVQEMMNAITQQTLNTFRRPVDLQISVPSAVQDSEAEEDCCVVCLSSKSCMKLSPCLHTCLCISCSEQFQSNDIHCCPLCRREINSISYTQ
jgi:hypothetical protein